jgi:hypothetical protein
VVSAVGVTESVPDVPDGEKLVPLQEVAASLDQVSVEDDPFSTAVGDAERETVGETATVADRLADPPGLEQVML